MAKTTTASKPIPRAQDLNADDRVIRARAEASEAADRLAQARATLATAEAHLKSNDWRRTASAADVAGALATSEEVRPRIGRLTIEAESADIRRQAVEDEVARVFAAEYVEAVFPTLREKLHEMHAAAVNALVTANEVAEAYKVINANANGLCLVSLIPQLGLLWEEVAGLRRLVMRLQLAAAQNTIAASLLPPPAPKHVIDPSRWVA